MTDVPSAEIPPRPTPPRREWSAALELLPGSSEASTIRPVPAVGAVAHIEGNDQGTGRLPALDVLRGIAILGTLAANIWLFQAFSGDEVVSEWWGYLIRGTADGKFLGLLTIMFGIGLEIQRQSALRHGRSWPGTYSVRAGLLFLDGVLNYILVVEFDVLRAYAIVAFIIAFVLLFSERWQWFFIGVALTTHLAILSADPAWLETLPSLVLPGEAPVVPGRPSWGESIAINVHYVFAGLTPGTSDAGTIILMGLVIFPLGAMAYRKGVFAASGARLRRWLMIIGLGVAAPVDLASMFTGEVFVFGRYFFSPIAAFGVLALVAEFYQRRRVGTVGRLLAAVGRMALSCYVLQNVLARILQSCIIGSPLESALDRIVGTLVMYAVVSLLVVVFAVTWQRFFRRGPLEFLWDLSFRVLTSPKMRSRT